MEESGLRGATRTAVGSTLAGPNGVLCMRTACQDIVPKCLSGACREAARGGNARELCRPRLVECQQDSAGIVGCAERCARYFGAADMPDCTRDCNRVRCREYEPYDSCVRVNTLADVLACFQRNCRDQAVACLSRRCDLEAVDVSLVKASMPGSEK